MVVCKSNITVAARSSRLAQMQVREVLQELQRHYPEVSFQLFSVETYGDLDRATSLRTLGSSDFFTREVDALLLDGSCQIAIHSAKDLPDPLSPELQIVALTSGVDPADVLVLRQEESLESLPVGAKIATSSVRREECVSQLCSDCSFIDLRGTIEERLAKLSDGSADGVVVAEAALIRLGLTHLNRVRLPGETARYQGQLAIVAHRANVEMHALFKPLDSRLINLDAV